MVLFPNTNLTNKTPMKTGAELIADERIRHQAVEGWTPEHDDAHDIGELCSAANAYLFAGDCIANAARFNPKYKCTAKSITEEILNNDKLVSWPWDEEWLKVSDDPVRNLVKAGALIAAEIDRLQRAAQRKENMKGSQPGA